MRNLGILAGLALMASCDSDPQPRLDEPYVAIHTHWQTGERAVYRSVEIYDGQHLVISPEVPQAEWDQAVCAQSNPRAVLALLDARADLAETNRNLSPRFGMLSDISLNALENSLAESIHEGCEERDFSKLTGTPGPHL